MCYNTYINITKKSRVQLPHKVPEPARKADRPRLGETKHLCVKKFFLRVQLPNGTPDRSPSKERPGWGSTSLRGGGSGMMCHFGRLPYWHLTDS